MSSTATGTVPARPQTIFEELHGYLTQAVKGFASNYCIHMHRTRQGLVPVYEYGSTLFRGENGEDTASFSLRLKGEPGPNTVEFSLDKSSLHVQFPSCPELEEDFYTPQLVQGSVLRYMENARSPGAPDGPWAIKLDYSAATPENRGLVMKDVEQLVLDVLWRVKKNTQHNKALPEFA